MLGVNKKIMSPPDAMVEPFFYYFTRSPVPIPHPSMLGTRPTRPYLRYTRETRIL